MATTFRPYEPDSAAGACGSRRGILRITSATWGLDLTAFYARRGRSAQRAVCAMVKVLLYGYGGVFVAKEEVGGGRGVSGAGGGKLSEPPHVVRVSPSAPGGWVVRGGGGSGAGLARFGKLSIDGTKVRANASKRKSYGARGGAALEGRGVAEHGCGGGRTLWGAVARGRVARRVAPSRGPAGGGGEGACGATRGVRGRRPEASPQGWATIAMNPRTRRRATSPTVPKPAPRGSSTMRRWRASIS